MIWWALAGCVGGDVCDPSQVPISDLEGLSTADDRLRVRSLLERFEQWSGYEVCLSEVEIVSNLHTDDGALLGRWRAGRRVIQLDMPSGLWENTVFHELCHAIDTDHELSARHPDLFPPDPIPDGGHYVSDEARRREHFARRCELGPVGPLVAMVEQRCGDPATAWIEREIWSGRSPEVDLRLAPSPEEKSIPRTQMTGASWFAVGPRMIERIHEHPEIGAAQAEYRFLDDALQPEGASLFLPIDVQLEAKRWRTLWSHDQLMWAPAGGEPFLLEPGRRARKVELPPDDWRGGWAGDSWWVWARDRPLDEGIKQLDRDGHVVGRHPLPSRGLGPLLEIDGQPVLQDLRRHATVLVDLDGEELATLPRDVRLSVQRGDLLLGSYSYDLPYGNAALNAEAAAEGLVWVDRAGIVYVESPCDDHDELPDRMAAPRFALALDEDADVTDVIDQTRSYPVEPRR